MLVIVSLLLIGNRHYVFESTLYESSDWAADSLLVRDAKREPLLHGHYSRWAFYHPGPALIDTLAAGEALFYDTLHVVPSPYNGQIIALCCVLTLCFSLALCIFARRLDPGGGFLFFLPLALFLALWHYGAANGRAIFLDSWPADTPILVFLCFLVAAASTAAGGGMELPILVVAAGWLVHNHVAQPIFVVPLTLLAYTGLLFSCRQASAAPLPPRRGIGGALSAGWRLFPRAHWIALALLAVFVLPLAVDALHGKDSNLALILEHVRTYHQPGKKLARSLCYFLTFAAYTPYEPGTQFFGRYDAAGMLAFFREHWRVYSLWLGALLGAPVLFATAWRAHRKSSAISSKPPWARFVGWFYVIALGAFLLTLYWGVKQDGDMFYFNAYFNYSIYFCVALLFAAALSVALMAWTQGNAARRFRPMVAALLWAAVIGGAVFQVNQFRLGDNFSTPGEAGMARTIERAAAAWPKNTVFYVECNPWEAWPIAIATVLHLERQGYKVCVNDGWEIMFGKSRTIQHMKFDETTPMAHWIVVPEKNDPARLSAWRLWHGFALDIKEPVSIDPAGGRIVFAKDGNFQDFALFGWSASDADWTWSDQRVGLMLFHPLPLPEGNTAGVDLLISAWSFTASNPPTPQRVEIQLNGITLATPSMPLFEPNVAPLRVRISADAWRQAAANRSARLRFVFLDAKSPASLGQSGDARPLGGGFRSIEFQPASSESAVAPPGPVVP